MQHRKNSVNSSADAAKFLQYALSRSGKNSF